MRPRIDRPAPDPQRSSTPAPRPPIAGGLSPGGLLLGTLALTGTAAAQGGAQVTFSVDYHGPLIGTPAGLAPLTEADLLRVPGGPNLGGTQPPAIVLTGGDLGIAAYTNCVGHLGGDPCGIEVDALTFGKDRLLTGLPGEHYVVYFVSDEYAVGNPGLTAAPSIATEAPSGDASGDVWVSQPLPLLPVPVPPTGQGRQHTGVLDGDGQPSASGFVYPGLGLVEPNRPGFGLPLFPRDEGSHLDALDISPGFVPGVDAVYFSLDFGQTDSVYGYANSNSAQLQGVSAGDVLVRTPGGALAIYAPAQMLGLDPLLDDLDALILHENGVPGYQQSFALYDWAAGAGGGALMPGGPAPDMLMFSVRRGSALIGTIDSILGLPIEPGDILVPGGTAFPPGIVITAESLGLATNRESGAEGDELAGASIQGLGEGFVDCNFNGVEDSVDISLGTSPDVNYNNIPDECEPPGTPGCFCTAGSDPCGNPYAAGGCANSTGVGAILAGAGSSSIFVDDLVMNVTQMTPSQFGLLFMGPAAIAPTPMGDGSRCVGGGLMRYLPPVASYGGGNASVGPGLVGHAAANFPASSWLVLGSTWHFQHWYRDPTGPCGSTFNVTNSVSVLFTP